MSTTEAPEAEGIIDINADTDQYLTFLLAGEEYGVDILRVQEIKEWDSVTSLPNTPSSVKGVINLRGTIVPSIDLRHRFSLECIAYGMTTVIIVLEVRHDGGSRIMGMVVDAVSDVYNVTEEVMTPPPKFGCSIETDVVRGLATIGEKMIIVLDVDRLLNSDELAIVDSIAPEQHEPHVGTA